MFLQNSYLEALTSGFSKYSCYLEIGPAESSEVENKFVKVNPHQSDWCPHQKRETKMRRQARDTCAHKESYVKGQQQERDLKRVNSLSWTFSFKNCEKMHFLLFKLTHLFRAVPVNLSLAVVSVAKCSDS